MVQGQDQAGGGKQWRQMDFAPRNRSRREAPAKTPEVEAELVSEPLEPAVPVTSAKAAINAMYAARAERPAPGLISSAREAMNAAAKQTASSTKTASNLHHGTVPPKSMESTRTSASAIIKTPGSTKAEVPVIRTSLKLGANARPKPKPVVLPPGARMARQARPLARPASPRAKFGQLLTHRPLDAQIVYPNTLNPGTSKPKLSTGSQKINVQIAPKSPKQLAAPKPTPVKVQSQPAPAQPTPKVPRSTTAQADFSAPTQRPAKFRPAPKGYAVARPKVKPDNNYAISAPPKIKVATPLEPEMGVVEPYRPTETPSQLGDKAPIGQVKEQPVASGHGRAAEPETIKSENTSNYSFSRKKPKMADNNRYALGGKSPFLKSVNVEKRPLSDNISPRKPKIECILPDDPKPTKASRKNVYQKPSKSDLQRELPTRPTVIIPSSRRSKAPLFFLILLTIVLGAVVGAAAYLCFFQ